MEPTKLQARSIRQATEIVRRYPLGTRLRCKEDGKLYQLGAKQGMSTFWMLREEPLHKGLVSAATIVDHFEVLKDEVPR